MRVVVCCKGVPIETKPEFVQIENGDIQYKETDFYVNEFDSYALEAAVAIKKSYGAETFALSLGRLRVQEVLYSAIAKGIDQVLRIDGETSRQELIAYSLIPALEELKPQLVLVGVQSEDWMGGEVGIYISQALNMSLAYAVTEICDLTDTIIRVKKELGGGKVAEVVLQLPAVLCIQTGIQPLQYISAVKRKKARNNPVKLAGKLCDLSSVKEKLSAMVAYQAEEVSLASTEGHAEMLVGDRSENVSKVLEIIRKTI